MPFEELSGIYDEESNGVATTLHRSKTKKGKKKRKNDNDNTGNESSE